MLLKIGGRSRGWSEDVLWAGITFRWRAHPLRRQWEACACYHRHGGSSLQFQRSSIEVLARRWEAIAYHHLQIFFQSSFRFNRHQWEACTYDHRLRGGSLGCCSAGGRPATCSDLCRRRIREYVLISLCGCIVSHGVGI